MKRYTVFFICSLVLILSANSVFAQGFTCPQEQNLFYGQQGFASSFVASAGFTGPVQNVTVLQVIQTFPNKTKAVLNGNIVMYLGGERYLFRDSTGEFVVKIKQDKWWGLTVGPNDLIEIGGELKRDKKTGQINYFDAKSIRRT